MIENIQQQHYYRTISCICTLEVQVLSTLSAALSHMKAHTIRTQLQCIHHIHIFKIPFISPHSSNPCLKYACARTILLVLNRYENVHKYVDVSRISEMGAG